MKKMLRLLTQRDISMVLYAHAATITDNIRRQNYINRIEECLNSE